MYTASVIINTYNGNQSWLIDAVDSYLNQKNVDIQLIVSTVEKDPSLITLKGYSDKIDFCISDYPNIYYQTNNGLKLVKKEWFAGAAGDDIANNDKIYEEIEVCLANNKKICSSGFTITDENLKAIVKRGKQREYSLEQHLKGNFVSDCSLIHSSLLKDYGPFDLNCGNHAFWDFWIRIAKDHPEYFIFDEKSRWLYRQHSNAQHIKRSKNKRKIIKNEAEHKAMLNKHIDILKKFNSEHLLYKKKYK